MKRIISATFLTLLGLGSTAQAQITNKGALIQGKGDVLISSSMDIQNAGDLSIKGTLDLKGKRKIASEKSISIDQLQLQDNLQLNGDVNISKAVDFGKNGLVKVANEKSLTFGSEASYTNYNHGKGIQGTAKKINAQDFVFPLGTDFEAFPVTVKEKQAIVEANLAPQISTDLGDFAESNLEMPNRVAIKVKGTEEIQPNKLKLQFDEQKEEVLLENGVWKEANKVAAANTLVATKAMSYNRTSALETAESRWVQVFPNPSNGEINIDMNAREANSNVSLRIIDLSGKTLKTEEKLGQDYLGHKTTLPNLDAGSYILQFEAADGKKANLKHTVVR